jgi:hypothetical protein
MVFAVQFETFAVTLFTVTLLPGRKPLPVIVTVPPKAGTFTDEDHCRCVRHLVQRIFNSLWSEGRVLLSE